jgi:hypothetical protein
MISFALLSWSLGSSGHLPYLLTSERAWDCPFLIPIPHDLGQVTAFQDVKVFILKMEGHDIHSSHFQLEDSKSPV